MNSNKLHAFIVTTDPTISQGFLEMEKPESWNFVLFEEVERVFAAAASLDRLEFLLLDEGVTGSGYLQVIRKARKRHPGILVMVVGGPKSDEVRVSERRDGVDYYFERPIDAKLLAAAIEHRLQIAWLKAVVGLVGRSLHIEEMIEAILQVAPTEVPILIEGESGTGKDLVAQAIHTASRRREGPYVAINCASLAEGVLESELFGHEKGSFTGAVGQRAGVFERAHRGTIFLDEVGEMSANMQVRILRVLESAEVLRVGGVKSFNVDVRVVAATNRNLATAVADGSFRQDLYYRLKGVNFFLVPIRDRKDDIPILIDHFIREANLKHGKSIKGIDSAALKKLVDNRWPGNVRELRNLIDTSVVLSTDNRITTGLVDSQLISQSGLPESHLPVALHRSKDEAEREMIYASVLALHRDVREVLALLRGGRGGEHLEPAREVFSDIGIRSQVKKLAQLERAAITEALRTSNGNRRKASEMLGISERTLYRKIKEYGLV